MDFQTTLQHNAIYFSVLVKIYETARCVPASNSSTLENSFAEGRNLISRGRFSEGARLTICFSTVKIIPIWEHSISQLADVNYRAAIYDMLKYFSKIPEQDLTHAGLDRASPLSSVIPEAPEESFMIVRATTLGEEVKTNQPECLSLHVFLTPCHHNLSRPQLAHDPMQPFI